MDSNCFFVVLNYFLLSFHFRSSSASPRIKPTASKSTITSWMKTSTLVTTWPAPMTSCYKTCTSIIVLRIRALLTWWNQVNQEHYVANKLFKSWQFLVQCLCRVLVFIVFSLFFRSTFSKKVYGTVWSINRNWYFKIIAECVALFILSRDCCQLLLRKTKSSL